MNKVVTINLNGNAYQLEEAGYDMLRVYLDDAARQLAGNPDKDEIIADIEQAIADKCRALLNSSRSVVLTKQVEQIIAEMGPVEDGSAKSPDDNPGAPSGGGSSASSQPAENPDDAGPVKRLYRIYEGAMISGVCNGLAAYFAIDPTIVRVIFVLLAFVTFGGMVLAYLILTMVLPSARTGAEKAAARGAPSTAQEFIRRAREGYYDATRTFHDKAAHREWKRRFKREMSGWSRNFQQEVQAHAHQWQANWQEAWRYHPGAYRGLWFTLSILSILSAVVSFAWIFASISLLTTGAVFGIALPSGMPLWVGFLILFVALQLFLSPVRAVRHTLGRHGWGGGSPCAPAFFGLWDAFVWLGVVALLVWFADRYVPQAHQALVNLPPALHSAAESIKHWWAQQ